MLPKRTLEFNRMTVQSAVRMTVQSAVQLSMLRLLCEASCD